MPLIHHRDIDDYVRWKWLVAGIRKVDGFSPRNVKRIVGGAVFGIRMNGLDVWYWKNFRIRWNYLLGYLRYREYYEINRNKN